VKLTEQANKHRFHHHSLSTTNLVMLVTSQTQVQWRMDVMTLSLQCAL